MTPRIVNRGSWQDPKKPITGPAWPGWGQGLSKVNTLVIHYPGGFWHGTRDPGAVLRQSNLNYLAKSPPYSLGYNWHIPEDGSLWEIRGWDIQNAANSAQDGGANENAWTYSVHVEVNKVDSNPNSDVTVEPTAAQIETIRWLAAEGSRRAGFQVRVVGHRDIKPTGCPGDKLYRLVQAHAFDPSVAVEPPHPPSPIPPVVPGGDDVIYLWRDTRFHNVFATNGGGFTQLTPQLAAAMAAGGAVKIEEAHDQTLKSALVQTGLTLSDLVPV